MTRVLVVDDHEFLRSSLIHMINDSPDLEVVGECGDGGEVVDAVRELRPHVVLMDLSMPGVCGLKATASVRSAHPNTEVLMLSSDASHTSRSAAKAHGAAGYLVKGTAAAVVLDAIRKVAGGATAWA